MIGEKKVVDVCCGPKGMWFDKQDKRVLFLDKRSETHYLKYPSGNYTEVIAPDEIGNFTDIKQPDNSFYLVVFDPPHIKRSGPDGRMTIRYGFLENNWEVMLKKGFSECFRILKPNGILIFKWCEVQFPLKKILTLTTEKPLFGHKTGKQAQTHWVVFIKKQLTSTCSGFADKAPQTTDV